MAKFPTLFIHDDDLNIVGVSDPKLRSDMDRLSPMIDAVNKFAKKHKAVLSIEDNRLRIGFHA